MTRVKAFVCVSVLLSWVLPLLGQQSVTAVSGVVPPLMRFSGVLSDVDGKPLTGVVGVTFYLYKDQQGGVPLWMESQNVTGDAKGRYSVQLGATKSYGLPTDVFASGEARWLGVQIAGQEEQARVLLLSVPYALKAADAETIGGLRPSAFVLASPSGSSAGSTSTAARTALASSASVGGTGTTNFIPKWTSSTALGNSVLFQSGTGGTAKVGINTTTPGSTLDVNGSGIINGNLSVKNLTASSEVQGQFGSFSGTNSNILVAQNESTGSSGIGIVGTSLATSGIGIEGNGVTGVLGQGTDCHINLCIGVEGTGTYGVEGTGVTALIGFGTGSGNLGIYGQGSSGIWGFSEQTTNGGIGVLGEASNGGVNAGVKGFSQSPNGTGVWGLGEGESKNATGFFGCCVVGMWGDTSATGNTPAGVVATADDSKAMFVQNNSPTGFPTGFFANIENTNHGLGVLVAQGAFGVCSFDTDGKAHCTQPFVTSAPVDNGQRQLGLYSMASPQNWFEDFGSGQLASGAAKVAFDPTFAQTVNPDSGYHVFLTPEGDCRGLYVTRKTASGFEVRELGGGQSNVAFSYRIVALRRGFENVRLEDQTAMLAKLKASIPKPLETPARWTPPSRPKPQHITLTAPPTMNAGSKK